MREFETSCEEWFCSKESPEINLEFKRICFHVFIQRCSPGDVFKKMVHSKKDNQYPVSDHRPFMDQNIIQMLSGMGALIQAKNHGIFCDVISEKWWPFFNTRRSKPTIFSVIKLPLSGKLSLLFRNQAQLTIASEGKEL